MLHSKCRQAPTCTDVLSRVLALVLGTAALRCLVCWLVAAALARPGVEAAALAGLRTGTPHGACSSR